MKGVSMGTMLTSVLMSFTEQICRMDTTAVGKLPSRCLTDILHWRWWSLFELDIWRSGIRSEY